MNTRQINSKKNNVIDLFSKQTAQVEASNVDYSLMNKLNNKHDSKVVKHAKRDNLLVLFPSFCA
ncbi:hypothetical protein KF707_15530 [Candidatus Obscuribacterales bacterium]|nr:hypothetical protein [Candidatus Obscuribacterales bacterium]MBX3137633.1 hypothetical protein [Candidatus Obscuribacterales bacterium]MBX3148878.1 hypothetical protein [Candidatus Obscuribacterales bacterium]